MNGDHSTSYWVSMILLLMANAVCSVCLWTPLDCSIWIVVTIVAVCGAGGPYILAFWFYNPSNPIHDQDSVIWLVVACMIVLMFVGLAGKLDHGLSFALIILTWIAGSAGFWRGCKDWVLVRKVSIG